LFGDRQAVAFERYHFFRMVGEDAQGLQSEINQNLRADTAFVLQEALAGDIHVELFARVVLDPRKRARGGQRGVDAESSPSVVQVNEHPAILTDDGFERALNNFMAIAFGGRENIPGEAVRMHAHERRRAGQASTNQSAVLFAVNSLSPCPRQKSASCGRRAIVPSSFMISQITPAGVSPAIRARSTDASVCPARTSTPPFRARRGKTCPGRARSVGRVPVSIAVRMVMARSAVLIPVVVPRRASIDSVKAVP
jgi:hypothetical protein